MLEITKQLIVEDVVNRITKDINVSRQDKLELINYVDEWLDGICLNDYIIGIGDLRGDVEFTCYYKMKGSDIPLVQKLYKQLKILEKKQSLEQDFV